MFEKAGWGNAFRYLPTGGEFYVEALLNLNFVQEITRPSGKFDRAIQVDR